MELDKDLQARQEARAAAKASEKAQQQLEAAGFPTLILNGDGVDRSNTSDGQISTRLGAFMEMLGGMK